MDQNIKDWIEDKITIEDLVEKITGCSTPSWSELHVGGNDLCNSSQQKN